MASDLPQCFLAVFILMAHSPPPDYRAGTSAKQHQITPLASFPPLAADQKSLPWWSFCHAFWGFLWFLVTSFFSVSSWLRSGKNPFPAPVFSTCSQLPTICQCRDIMPSSNLCPLRLGILGITHPYPAPRAGRCSEGWRPNFRALPARAGHAPDLPGLKRRGKLPSLRHPHSPRAGRADLPGDRLPESAPVPTRRL